MKKGGGKQKGGEFERYVAKALSNWLSKGKRDDLLWRSAMSGGRATVKRKKGHKGKTSCDGDITAVDPLGNKLTDKFMIECKSYKKLNMESLIYGKPKNGILEFWDKLEKEAKEVEKCPLLICKENGKPPLICLNNFGALHFHYPTSSYFNGSVKYSLELYVMFFDDFLKKVKPELRIIY